MKPKTHHSTNNPLLFIWGDLSNKYPTALNKKVEVNNKLPIS